MNSTEIVKHILEADEDFDPIDYVKSATNRESAVEVYNGPLVRVIQPLAAFTINNYLPDDRGWDDSYYQSIAKSGPIYLAVDKSDHDNLAIFQPSTNNAWNNEGKQVDFKEIPMLISSTGPATPGYGGAKNPQEDKNWLDLQQGLATFFMSQIAKKKDVGQWVKYLTMIGRTDLATNYARYLGRAKLPFGKSIDAVLAMKKAGKRSRNRIARLMKNQTDVKWGEKGFWLLFDDWVDLAPFYGESRNYDYAKNAEKIFSSDTREWFENAETKPEDVWDEINEKNLGLINQLLANRTVYNSDGEESVITADMLAELDSREVKDIVCDRGNKNDSTEDIYDAIRYAADDAYVSDMENAYYEGYRNALMKQWGLQEDKTIKWIKVGKPAPDKKGKDGTVEKGQQKHMLGIWFPYSTLEEWIKQWKEDEYEDDFYGDVHDLAKAYLEKVEPNDDYSGNGDSDYFNEQLDYHLNELEPVQPERVQDPAQPELPMSGESDPKPKELERTKTVAVGDHPDQKEYKGIPSGEAHAYAQAMAPQRKDIHLRAEALLAYPLNRIDENDIDPKSFVRNVPLFYVLDWEWEPGQHMYFGRYPSDNYAQLGGTPQDELTLKFDSAEEAEKFLAGAQWGTREWGNEKPFVVTPVQAAAPKLEERQGDKKIEFEASDEAAESLVPLLKELRKMGSQGSSRNIKIDDWDGRSSFGFDGDGASKIGEIKVDGQVVEAQQLDEAIYKRSTTQIDLPKEIGGHIIQWGELNIADEDLYIDEKDGCGRETEQHVTVLYGLTDPTPPEALTHIVETTKPFLVEFGGVSVFENEKYDVIKLDVISEELHNLHMEIRRSCPNENKFPDYIPHCTIAYVQKGKGKKYAGQDVFKTAKVPRDFWAYDLLFKGAGDSEDGNRVVQLISFDKSKPIERDEPEAGEQRYPEATREEPEMAVAESEVKSFLARNVPMDCPECHSHNLTEPDDEGLVDCLECGIWFNPLHPANRPVAENVDPKSIALKVSTKKHQVMGTRSDNGKPLPPLDKSVSKKRAEQIAAYYRDNKLSRDASAVSAYEAEEVDPKQFLQSHYEEWVIVADDPKRQHPLLYLSDTGVQFVASLALARRFADEAEVRSMIDLIRSSIPRSIQASLNAVKLPVNESDEINLKQFISKIPHHELLHWDEAGPEGGYKCSCGAWRYKLTGWSSSIGNALKEFRAHKRLEKAKEKAKLAEAEELNAKEFLNRTTNYRIRCGVGAQTKYLHQEVGTGALKWHDFEGASLFDSDKAGEMLDQIGEIYGGQPVVAELAESEIDTKAMAMRVPSHYVVRSDHTPPEYLAIGLPDDKTYVYQTSDRKQAKVFNGAEAEEWAEHLSSPHRTNPNKPRPTWTAVPANVNETLKGPFEDDGLPGEVSSFLRKVRSKRPKKAKQQVI